MLDSELIAVCLADQDSAANLDPLDDIHQHTLFTAAVFQVDEQRKTRHSNHPFLAYVGALLQAPTRT